MSPQTSSDHGVWAGTGVGRHALREGESVRTEARRHPAGPGGLPAAAVRPAQLPGGQVPSPQSGRGHGGGSPHVTPKAQGAASLRATAGGAEPPGTPDRPVGHRDEVLALLSHPAPLTPPPGPVCGGRGGRAWGASARGALWTRRRLAPGCSCPWRASQGTRCARTWPRGPLQVSVPPTCRTQSPTVLADVGKAKGKDKERKPSLAQGEWRLRGGRQALAWLRKPRGLAPPGGEHRGGLGTGSWPGPPPTTGGWEAPGGSARSRRPAPGVGS